MKLVSIINEALIFTGISGTSREDIYLEMLKRAKKVFESDYNPDNNFKFDVEKVCAGIIERENVLHLPYEGVALPHIRMPEFNDLYFIIGILPEAVLLQEHDAKPSRIVMISLISGDTSDLYLKGLAAFARFVGKEENRTALENARNGAEFCQVLREADVRVHNNLSASDLATDDIPAIHPEETLSHALDVFTSSNRSCLPVVDNNGKLIAELNSTDVMRQFIPEYLFRMDHLDFVNSFDPFNRIFREEDEHFVKDYMSPVKLQVKEDTPLIQFTVKMVKDKVGTCFVVDTDGNYKGVIITKDIVKKVLRG